MANKRTLKKMINYASSEIFAEGVAATYYKKNCDKANVNALLTSIINTNSIYIQRISHPEPGMSRKAYYNDLIEKFNAEMSDIIDHICNL